ncbi:MAG: TatD family hydrolase [Lachnospiraceae bacterium]|nr:TatD family hydrolase [Lachnospiraceae bacterium]
MDNFLMDAHMHFDLYKKREDVLSYIEAHHSYTIAVTNLPELYERYYQLYANFKHIKIALGFHPELVFQCQRQLPVFLKYVEITRYIGEVGLDFTTQDKANKEIQREVFCKIVDACQKDDKILSVHSRRAEAECLQILKQFKGKVIMHWFSGSARILKEALEMGCYFSINQQMLLSKNGRGIVDALPMNRILIESDAPFSKGMEEHYSFLFADKIYDYLSKEKAVPKLEISQLIKNNFRTVIS